MPSLKIQLLCAGLGLGGVVSAITVPIVLTRRGGQTQSASSGTSHQRTTTQTPQPVLKWPDDYSRQCYKVLVDRGTGEFIACSGRKNQWEDLPLFFLWWTKDADKKYVSPIAVDQIKVEGDGQISFLSKRNGTVVKISEQDAKLKDEKKKLSGLAGKSLKGDNCKIEHNQLQCSSAGNFELAEKQHTTFYI